MKKEDLEYSIRQALRCEFDISNKLRMIEIYETSKAMGYDDQADEMKSDIYADYNLILD